MNKYVLILQYLNSDNATPEGENFGIYGPVEAKNKKEAENKFDAVFPSETNQDIIDKGKVPYPAPGGCNNIIIVQCNSSRDDDEYAESVIIGKNNILIYGRNN